MTKAGYLLINGAFTVVLCGLGMSCRAQTPASASPVASPGAVDPKDPPAGTPPSTKDGASDTARDNADVPASAPDLRLQTEVEDALSKVPELSNDSLRVSALPDGLEIAGNVVTGREREAAVRIAQSYARGRKVIDHIVVSGRPPAAAEGSKTVHQANSQP